MGLGLGIKPKIIRFVSALNMAGKTLRFVGDKTSISDSYRYPLACYLASKDEDLFKTFKRNISTGRFLNIFQRKTAASISAS